MLVEDVLQREQASQRYKQKASESVEKNLISPTKLPHPRQSVPRTEHMSSTKRRKQDNARGTQSLIEAPPAGKEATRLVLDFEQKKKRTRGREDETVEERKRKKEKRDKSERASLARESVLKKAGEGAIVQEANKAIMKKQLTPSKPNPKNHVRPKSTQSSVARTSTTGHTNRIGSMGVGNGKQLGPKKGSIKQTSQTNTLQCDTGKRSNLTQLVRDFSYDLGKSKQAPSNASIGHSEHAMVIDLRSSDDDEVEPLNVKPPAMPPSPHKRPTEATEPPLCKEQADLVDLILDGQNVFYTGSAGCGKSTVLKAFVKRMKELHPKPKQVDIIAPTGRAALDINGRTFYTYAGWTPDSFKQPLKELKAKAHGKLVRKRLQETDVLVVDEISMVENQHFERLNEIMKEARGDERPFGGVQIVVTGDFCQLPPVKPFQYCMACGKEMQQQLAGTTYKCPSSHHGSFKDSEKWAFSSTVWESCEFAHVELRNIHRQNDKVFIELLQKCRLGIPFSSADESLLLDHNTLSGKFVKLFSTREEVRIVNEAAFNVLRSPVKRFPCYDDFRCESPFLEWKGRRNDDSTLVALREHRFDSCIELKQGMLVVLLTNLEIASGLVNGSQGTIVGFERADPSKLPKAAEKGRPQMSLSSSVPILQGEHADERAANIRSFMDRAGSPEWPVVLFQNGVKRSILPDCRIKEEGDEKPYSLLSRTQIPLVAGWAMTVHKSQGMTLDRVSVNLSKSFEEGQTYVALSRARSLEGLKVEGLGRQHGRNEQVGLFLKDKFSIC